MKYSYLAIDGKNKKYRSEVTAESREDVKRILAERGMTAIEISETKDSIAGDDQSGVAWYQRDIQTKDIHDVELPKKKVLTTMHQMGIMMKSGISLSMAMEVLLDTEADRTMKRILNIVSSELYNGVPLSQSMGSFKTFPEIVISLVAAGEANGRLDMAFDNAADILHREIALSSKIKSAMMYPIFLIVLVIGVIIIFTVFVIPRFSGVYSGFGAELPGITQGLLNFSEFLMNYWFITLVVVGGIIFAFIMLKKNNDNFAMLVAEYLLKIPLVGPIIRQSSLARFCRLMSTLTDAGIPIHRAMALSRDAVPNIYVREKVNAVLEDVQIGVTINEAMAKHTVFDSILVSMIRVGEESGMLGDSLMKMADLFETQTDESTQKLTDSMTPIMTVVIGGVVGVLVVGMYMPMFSMYSIIK